MAKQIQIEEFHLTVFALRGLPEREYDAIRQTLDDNDFQTRLRCAVRAVIRRHPTLRKVKITLTR